MKLILPTKKYKESYYELINSASQNDECEFFGYSLIRENESFEEMIIRLKNKRIGKNLEENDVASTIFWMIENDKIVGIIEMRHYLNHYYFTTLGHVTCYIKKEYRNNGYATEALKQVIKKYKKRFVNRIVIMALEDDKSAIKVIVKNGGFLDKQWFSDEYNKNINRYNIVTNNGKIKVPKTVWLRTNGSCNNSCEYCHTVDFNTESMDYEKMKKYIDFLSKKGTTKIIFIGGEPTLYKDIIKATKYASSKGMVVSIYTNGKEFSNIEFTKKMIDAGLKNANIMIKGYSEEDYVNNTGQQGFNQMVEGYHNLKKYGIKVTTSYILSETTIKHFDEFVKSFEEKKLDNLLLQTYKPYTKIKHPSYTVSNLASYLEKAYEILKQTKIKYTIELSIPLCTIKEKVLKDMIDNNKVINNCHITTGSGMVINHKFDIVPCNQFVSSPLNTYKVELDELINFWNGQTCNEFRDIIETYPTPKCSKCRMWEKCGGGCLIHWLEKGTEEYIKDTYLERKK